MALSTFVGYLEEKYVKNETSKIVKKVTSENKIIDTIFEKIYWIPINVKTKNSNNH
jgi:hypothetical protein